MLSHDRGYQITEKGHICRMFCLHTHIKRESHANTLVFVTSLPQVLALSHVVLTQVSFRTIAPIECRDNTLKFTKVCPKYVSYFTRRLACINSEVDKALLNKPVRYEYN